MQVNGVSMIKIISLTASKVIVIKSYQKHAKAMERKFVVLITRLTNQIVIENKKLAEITKLS